MKILYCIILSLLACALICGFLGALLSAGLCVLMATLIGLCAVVGYSDQEGP